MFDLKRPCANCPFRKSQGKLYRLDQRRLVEIFFATAFQCHKTVDYDSDADERPQPGDHPQQCAGLMAVLARSGRPNRIMQVAERLGFLDLDALDPDNEAYASIEAAMKDHEE